MFQSNVRLKSAIIGFSVSLSLVVYLYVIRLDFSPDLEYLHLDRFYGLISLSYLIIVMLAGPLYRLYPNLPFKSAHRASLGGLGISTFYFAFLHFVAGFFGTLHGFAGLPFLDGTYLSADILGLIALIVLAIMAGTSFTWAMQALGKKWKIIHRFIYLAAIALIVHIVLIGTDFADLTSPVAFIFILLFLLLAILHTISSYRYLLVRFPEVSSRFFSAGLSVLLIGSIYLLFILHEAIIGGHVH